MRRATWLAAGLAGIALGAASVLIARAHPGYAFAETGTGVAVELLAGYLLVGCGLAWLRRRPGARFGLLLATGGCAWFLVEWNNPAVGSPVVFTLGLVLYAAAPPVVAHALLAFPAASLGRLERAVIAVAYCGALAVLGLLPALVFDPSAQGCSECPRNLLLLHASGAGYQALTRAGVYVGLAWVTVVIGLLGQRLACASVAMRGLVAPVWVAGGLYLSMVAAEFVVSLHRGFLSNDPLDRRLWSAQAVTLVLVAAAVAWSWLRERRTRAGLARLVVELAEAPSLGRLEHALARRLRDPELRISYPLGDGRLVDAEGRPRELGQTSTPLVRDGVEVAVLTHKPGLLDAPGLPEEVAAVARLALENERLHAQLLAQLADLRGSRARIVATSDRERRRLERDLHDGAQQRLVALTLDLRIARIRLEADSSPDRQLITRTRQAEHEVRDALRALRRLAAGIFPAALADEGLAAAVHALLEETPARIRIARIPDGRFAAPVETAAFRLISETVKCAGSEPVALTGFTDDGLLVIELESDGSPCALGELQDRLGALDGTLHIDHMNSGKVRIHAEIPCAW